MKSPNDLKPAKLPKTWQALLFLIAVLLFIYWVVIKPIVDESKRPNYPAVVDPTCHSVTVTQTIITRDEQGRQLFINGNTPTTETGTECGDGQFYPFNPPG